MKNKYLCYIRENREMAYFFGGIMIFMVLFLTLGLFLLFGARSNFAQAEILKNRLISIRKFQQQYGDIAAHRGDLESKLNRLAEQVPQNVDANDLLLHINTMAAMGNVKIENLSILPEVSNFRKSGYKANRLQITCIAQCQQLLDFMKAVEREENLMLFDDVAMEAKEDDKVFLSAVIIYCTRF